ncbi:MAG: flagellar hook-length control protein FliK [Nitrospinae bacterium]|nr:flagellar hook-length control protein FliK [Nitrospinota bacterium]
MIHPGDSSIRFLRSVSRAPEGQPAPEARFQVGDILKGTVLSVLGKEMATVRLGGMELVALTPQPLQDGEAIVVRVEQLKPQFTVRLLPQEVGAQDRLSALFRLYLPQKIPLGEAILPLARMLRAAPAISPAIQETLRDLELFLQAWSPDPPQEDSDSWGRGDPLRGGAPTARDIRLQLQRSGVFYESRLVEWIARGKEGPLSRMAERDLKGLLLKIEQWLGEESARLAQQGQSLPEPGAGISRSVKTLLANIELNQLANQQASEHGGWMLYQLPGGASVSPFTIRLYVHRDGGKGQEKEKPDYLKLVLMLEPRNLGPLRADLSLLGKRLSARIYVAFEETRQFLDSWLPDLANAFRDAGFTSQVEARTANMDFLTQNLEEKPGGESPSGLLNLIA